MGPTKAEPPPPRRWPPPPRLLRFWRFWPPWRPLLLPLLPLLPLLCPFWPGFWLPKLRLRRRDLRLRGFCGCGWFNPSFIRIPVGFGLVLPSLHTWFEPV